MSLYLSLSNESSIRLQFASCVTCRNLWLITSHVEGHFTGHPGLNGLEYVFPHYTGLLKVYAPPRWLGFDSIAVCSIERNISHWFVYGWQYFGRIAKKSTSTHSSHSYTGFGEGGYWSSSSWELESEIVFSRVEWWLQLVATLSVPLSWLHLALFGFAIRTKTSAFLHLRS